MEFDYAVYFIEDGTQPSSSQHKVSTGAIVGGVVGGLIVVSTLSLLLFFRQRKITKIFVKIEDPENRGVI
ncbi:hypothetical protein PILCRDRAFT_16857 [Piloderma croceum F 1598]|uniref:Uncharacterized protein n=1 Tax=Piloderma croceum (strain F 1598) TaxID=765440 RepID=A0A0C3EG90_PILCF|nr:hypothetical protein PILCRDRAFT_16857 [Piloderma croceum F 1598]